MQYQNNKQCFFWKVAVVLDDFKVMESSFQILGRATDKAHLPGLNLVLETKSCLET